MTTKELVMKIIVDRIDNLENEINALEKSLAFKRVELEKFTYLLNEADENEDE